MLQFHVSTHRHCNETLTWDVFVYTPTQPRVLAEVEIKGKIS